MDDIEVLRRALPVLPHEAVADVECDGCISIRLNGSDAELRCTVCGAMVGTLRVEVLRLVLGLDGARATCPYCGVVNTFPASPRCRRIHAKPAAGAWKCHRRR